MTITDARRALGELRAQHTARERTFAATAKENWSAFLKESEQARNDARLGRVDHGIASHEAGHVVCLIALGGEARGAYAGARTGAVHAIGDWPQAAGVSGAVAARMLGHKMPDSPADLLGVTNVENARRVAVDVLNRNYSMLVKVTRLLVARGALDAAELAIATDPIRKVA